MFKENVLLPSRFVRAQPNFQKYPCVN